MNRTIANVIIDLVAAVLFVAMIATGYILRFPLPPGTNRVLELWGLTRHQWGSFHSGTSLALLAVIAVHLVLHWKWIVTVIGKRLHLVTTPKPSMIRSGMIAGGVFAAVFGIFAFSVHWGVREMAEPLHDLNISDANAPAEISHPELRSTETQTPPAHWEDAYAVLKTRCISCHGQKQQLGGFRADERSDYFDRNGNPPLVVPGNSAESPLIEIVSGGRPQMRMFDSHNLPESELQLLRIWIDAGADWPDK